MNKNERKRFSPPAVGGTSLLVVFAVLCFTVFALLSLTTTQADNRISIAGAKSTSEYYEADCEAQTILARIRNGEMPDGVMREGNLYSYECTVSDTQRLSVTVRIENGRYDILRWETGTAGDRVIDESINLWNGTEEEQEDYDDRIAGVSE